MPDAAGQDAGVGAAHRKAVVGVQVQDHAFLVGKGQQEVGPGNLLRQGFQLSLGQSARHSGAVAAARQVGGVHHRNQRWPGAVQPGLHAAHPAVQDGGGGQAIGRQRVAAGAHGLGMGHVVGAVVDNMGRSGGRSNQFGIGGQGSLRGADQRRLCLHSSSVARWRQLTCFCTGFASTVAGLYRRLRPLCGSCWRKSTGIAGLPELVCGLPVEQAAPVTAQWLPATRSPQHRHPWSETP